MVLVGALGVIHTNCYEKACGVNVNSLIIVFPHTQEVVLRRF